LDSDTNVVEVAVRRLRQKTEDPLERKLMHTVRGMVYVLEDGSARVAATRWHGA
jgi:two-component system, OmpR family, copper resistance phosphate regulon response regulator CusR